MRHVRSLAILVPLVVAFGGGTGACSSSTCADDGTCYSPDPNADGGGVTDGSSEDGDVPVPPGCDPKADVKDAPKCVVSEYGVFVDAEGGNDSNSGTKELPVKTVGAALTKLNGKPRVYVCEGTYAESVKLTSAVSVYGGFSCGTWEYTGKATQIAPSASGVGLTVTGAKSAVVVSDVEVRSQDAVGAGESSVAMFVGSSTEVTFRRVTAKAGKGKDGQDAPASAAFTPPAAPDGTSGVNGGDETPNPSCTTSKGGAGGKDGATAGADGKVAVTPPFPTVDNTGKGGAFTNGASCATGLGLDGSYGVAGASGAGATKLGEITAEGWRGADGAAGGKGGDGQGGGGGGQRLGGGVGGSGGPGGCGGAGGEKGTAGGSSLALVVFESAVSLESSKLVASDAGKGGSGGKGGKGQLASGTLPAPNDGGKACSGGIGGHGGSGGGGGGGAGGVSAGLVYTGTAPVLDGTATPGADTHASVTLGNAGGAGAKGAGGDPAQPTVPISRAGEEGKDGIAGEAKAVLAVP